MAITYNSTPDGLLTYASPSPKRCRQVDGVFRYQPHNIYLNSAAPANQSITVVSGATYEIIITGSVSITWSGAYTGTTTAGTHAFTAATATLTGGSTSGTGTVSVRRTPSANTYIATTGAAVYRLPYEWNDSGSPLGIRVEKARTNLRLRSTEMDNAVWSKIGVTVTANNTTAPDGTNTADAIFEVDGANIPRIAQQATTVSGDTYTSSFFAKANGRTQVRAVMEGSGNFAPYFTLAGSGSVTGVVLPSTATITNVGNGWYYCTFTYTATKTNDSYYIATANAGSPISSGVAGLGVFIWGAQMEAGSFASSPIETFGSTVTRAADNISLATSAFPLNAAVGTIICQYIPTAIPASPNLLSPASLYTDASNYMTLNYLHTNGVTSFVVNADGVFQADFGPSPDAAILSGQTAKVAVAYGLNNFGNSLNGSVATTDTSGTVPTVNTLGVGQRFSSSVLDGHIQSLVYLPRRAADAELQSFSTL